MRQVKCIFSNIGEHCLHTREPEKESCKCPVDYGWDRVQTVLPTERPSKKNLINYAK